MATFSISSRIRSRLIRDSFRRLSFPNIQDEAGARPNLIKRRRSVIAPSFEPGMNCRKIYHAKTDEARKKLKLALEKIFLFKSLPPEQLESILDSMEERQVSENEQIVKEGDEGDYMYVIDKGSFVVSMINGNGKSEEKCRYNNEGIFGELALMHYTKRAATMTATRNRFTKNSTNNSQQLVLCETSPSDGTVWTLDRDTFRTLVLNRAFDKRRTFDQFLRSVPILGTLTEYERMNVADVLTTKLFNDGECVMKQGDSLSEGMYFVEEGKARVVHCNDDGQEHQLGQLEQGHHFGEFALITNRSRISSIYALGKLKLAFLDRFAFERLFGSCVELMKRNIQLYEQQIEAISDENLPILVEKINKNI